MTGKFALQLLGCVRADRRLGHSTGVSPCVGSTVWVGGQLTLAALVPGCGRSVGSRQTWPPAHSIGGLAGIRGSGCYRRVECARRTRAHLRRLRDDIGRQDLSCRRVWSFRGAAFALAQPRWAGRIRSIERSHSARRCVRWGHARRVTGARVCESSARADARRPGPHDCALKPVRFAHLSDGSAAPRHRCPRSLA